MAFKVGDQVRVARIVPGGWGQDKVGCQATVIDIEHRFGSIDAFYTLRFYRSDTSSGWREYELELVVPAKKKEQVTHMSKRHYRVVKDTPLWDKDAILQRNENGDYTAIEDFWDTDPAAAYREDGKDPMMVAAIVEKSPEWFEQVYEMSHLGKLAYVTKTEAKKQAAKFFKHPTGTKEVK